ncbi:adenosylmethionine decarboxylase [Bacillus nitroreducens]
MNIEGQHIILDIYGCNPTILDDMDYLEHLCEKVANNTNMEVLYTYFHQFYPHGVTGMLVLSTSHLSIHTWPEKGYASLDFYTCGDRNIETQVEILLKGLESSHAIVYFIARGTTYPQIIKGNHVSIRDFSPTENPDKQGD